MAASAFVELGLVCDLFEKGAIYSRRARDGLVRDFPRHDIQRLSGTSLKGCPL
jgi:hypothetical protein